MAGIKLWGRNTSSNVQKVLWTLRELDLPFEHVVVGGKHGGLDTPAYGAMNPNRLVPVIEDGDLVLWESHAIVRYLAASYGAGTLWPEHPRERALVDQWTDWTASTYLPAWSSVFWAVVRTPAAQRDPGKIASGVAATHQALAIMDAQLARTPFLAGDSLTYADIVAGVTLYRWTTMEIERQPMPHVEAWHQRLNQRPAYAETVNTSYDDLRA